LKKDCGSSTLSSSISLANVHTASSSPLPATDGSDIFWVFSSSFFSSSPPHLFQAGLVGGQQSGAKQHRPGGPYSIAVVSRLMKMLDSASFYTLSGNIPAIFLIHFGHSCYIPSTFEVHRYSSCILFEFLDARTVFGSHSASILTAFVQHSRHLPTGLQALFWQQSNCSSMAFAVHTEHYDSILYIPTVCKLNGRGIKTGFFDQ